MNMDYNFQNLSNLTTITTTLTDRGDTTSDDNLKSTLSYAIPLSCLAVIIVLIIIIGIRQRDRVLDKWISLTQMRNTNPKFRQRTGLRRDSEFESYLQDDIQPITINEETPQEYSLTTKF